MIMSDVLCYIQSKESHQINLKHCKEESKKDHLIIIFYLMVTILIF